MNAEHFVSELSRLRFPNVFNPYFDTCPVHDGRNAAAIRCRNLALVLGAAMNRGVDSIWVGRDLGYRGGRRTGLALTDEAHLSSHAAAFGCRALERATRGPPVAERTASVIWDRLTALGRPVFLWNVFPLHPHEAGAPMTNRCHTRGERQACRDSMMWLLTTLSPKFIVAIGRDAQVALDDLGIAATGVRHPSYGGQAEFIAGIVELYGLPATRRNGAQLALSS